MYREVLNMDNGNPFSPFPPSLISVILGEFYCPLCRQRSNCILPLIPAAVLQACRRHVTFSGGDEESSVLEYAQMDASQLAEAIHERLQIRRIPVDYVIVGGVSRRSSCPYWSLGRLTTIHFMRFYTHVAREYGPSTIQEHRVVIF